MFSGRSSGRPLDRAQGAQLGQGEVLGEPAGAQPSGDVLGGAQVRELRPRGDVGRRRQLVLVPDDQDAVLADDDVGLDQVGALLDRQLVAGGGVLGSVGGRAAVADDHGTGKAGRQGLDRRLGRVHAH